MNSERILRPAFILFRGGGQGLFDEGFLVGQISQRGRNNEERKILSTFQNLTLRFFNIDCYNGQRI